jgi:hypothetical protein
MASSGMLRRLTLVRTDVSEELSTSFIELTKIGELGTTLAVTSNRRRRSLLLAFQHLISGDSLRKCEGQSWYKVQAITVFRFD